MPGPDRPSTSSERHDPHGSSDRRAQEPPTIVSGRAPAEALASALPAPQVGDRLDSFTLERAIGVGGMGAVFLAADSRLHRDVALKLLPPALAADSDSVQRFYQEARSAARLEHENIARVYTIGADKGHHFIAFEYVEGETLRQKIHDAGQIPVADAVNYALQVACALVHANERGVVHRDVKPSNVIVTAHGRAKLVDMGLARSFERGAGLTDHGLTHSGMTLGTFDYISPEQALDPRGVDVRGDLYSLGCTLFHMLAGRPPFPEGTALQKLRQHEKEPPPDLAGLNPAVPPDLAAIVAKLMAKDRERRYQTPELLVRDLLTTAGALGLRSIGPEGLIWMSPQAAPAWEKHLVWAVPAAAFAAVVSLMVWWGQNPRPTAPAADPRLPVASVPPPVPTPAPPTTAPKVVQARPTPEDVPPAVLPQRPAVVVLKAGEDLSAAIAREASGSTFVLADDGPYLLGPAPAPPSGRRDVTIRAAIDARPVLRPARGARSAPERGDPALLDFGPGVVLIDGVEFRLDDEAGTAWAAVRADRTDLDLRRCTFRATDRRPALSPTSAVRVRSTRAAAVAAAADHPGSVAADACLFAGGLVPFWVQGPIELRLRDCCFGPGEPAFWFDNAGAAEPVPAELILRHASARAEAGPVVRATRTALRAVVEQSVFATDRDRTATLVETDEPDLLAWRGKENLYSGIATYLKAGRALVGRSRIDGFDAWADDPRADREAGSIPVAPPVWEASSPSSRPLTSTSFALSALDRPSPDVGARRGPRGPIVSIDEGLATLLGLDPPTLPRRVATAPFRLLDGAATVQAPPETRRPLPPMPEAGATAKGDEVQPMFRPQEDEVIAKPAEVRPPTPPPVGLVPVDVKPPVDLEPAAAAAEPAEPDAAAPIRTPGALAAALERLGPKGGTITLAADADLELESLAHRGPGRVLIQAEDGDSRPVLRFPARPRDAVRLNGSASILSVETGTVELRGLDVVVPEADDARSAFRVTPGADLALVRCTVTVEASASGSSLVRISPSLRGEPSDSPGTVRATDCLLRSAGDLIAVDAGCRLEAEWTNVVAGSKGALVHAQGRIRSEPDATLRLVLRQVSARVAGGLAFLESSPEEPVVAVLDVLARDVVLATSDDDAPLIRVDGQDSLDALRDRVRWDGQGVQYHRIDTYRRDQTSRPGTMPQRFDRTSWDVSVALREAAPFHGDVRFLAPWTPGRSPATITAEDVALDPDGPSSTSGPDLKRIPAAPLFD